MTTEVGPLWPGQGSECQRKSDGMGRGLDFRGSLSDMDKG